MNLSEKVLTSLFFLIYIRKSIQYFFNKEFYYCSTSNQSIDFDLKCSNYYCIIYKNILTSFLKYDDEFNFVYTLNEKKKVVYTNNGRIFYANCKIIHGIEILEKLSICHKDVAVLI